MNIVKRYSCAAAHDTVCIEAYTMSLGMLHALRKQWVWSERGNPCEELVSSDP